MLFVWSLVLDCRVFSHRLDLLLPPPDHHHPLGLAFDATKVEVLHAVVVITAHRLFFSLRSLILSETGLCVVATKAGRKLPRQEEKEKIKTTVWKKEETKNQQQKLWLMVLLLLLLFLHSPGQDLSHR